MDLSSYGGLINFSRTSHFENLNVRSTGYIFMGRDKSRLVPTEKLKNELFVACVFAERKTQIHDK